LEGSKEELEKIKVQIKKILFKIKAALNNNDLDYHRDEKKN
jgi:hypothetical protein